MAIIGIDLGTTNSLACIYHDGKAELIPNELEDFKTSSAVSVLEGGTVLRVYDMQPPVAELKG